MNALQIITLCFVPLFKETIGYGSEKVWYYHAPPRQVPFLAVDSEIKRGFLELFRLEKIKSTKISTVANIDPGTIAEINRLCPPHSFFHGFSSRHRNASILLTKALRKTQDYTPPSELAAEILRIAQEEIRRNEINPIVWYIALVRTFLQTPALAGYNVAWPIDAIPDIYIANTVIENALESDTCTPSDGTGGATGLENVLDYFREDPELVQEHWYWHQVFPLTAPRQWDRRGEHFYWMHHNFLARYQAARLASYLPLEVALDLRVGGDIGEGYDADLFDRTSMEYYAPRPAHTLLQDIDHSDDPDFLYEMPIGTLQGILNMLQTDEAGGFLVLPDNSKLNLLNDEGVNFVGNTMEANELSVNPDRYLPFGLHNNAHNVIGLSADPDFLLGLPAGVMADPATAPRDPAFFKIHAMVDDLVNRHKETLIPYQLEDGEWPLVWKEVTIINFEVESDDENYDFLKTFWRIKKWPLEEGINGRIHDGTVHPKICQKHLDHEGFTFALSVAVESSKTLRGNVRLFMAPREDENGNRFKLRIERRLLFQLDVFPVELSPGLNHITRKSSDSSSTRPWSRSLQDMLSNLDNSGHLEYCGCGFPAHLYLPKGNKKGMTYDLFAMITDYEEDYVENDPEDLKVPELCNMPYIFCGIPFRKYPDARPMGYPFDRLPYEVHDKEVMTLEEYVEYVPNMFVTEVIIKHLDIVMENDYQHEHNRKEHDY